jgi:hypothetical protein
VAVNVRAHLLPARFTSPSALALAGALPSDAVRIDVSTPLPTADGQPSESALPSVDVTAAAHTPQPAPADQQQQQLQVVFLIGIAV